MEISELVDKARQGDRMAMKGLVEGIRSPLHEYVNRLTLDQDLTDDIVQGSLITMMEHLSTLQQTDQFWPWLSKIVLNRMRRSYRDHGRYKTRSLEGPQFQETPSHDHTVVADAITHELRQIALSAMRELKPDLRTILVLRCYRSQWPGHLKIVDQRDMIHKKGWTCFTLAGEIGGVPIAGIGSMPLVPAKTKEYPPWIHLKIGDDLVLKDNSSVAFIKNAQGKMAKQFQGGTFFAGMARPWQGLHTIDTVRRDAASQQIVFETELSDGSDTALIHLDCGSVQIVYRISMQADLISEIGFSLSDGSEGTMHFNYPHELDATDQGVMRSKTSLRTTSRHRDPGLSWLVQLASGTLGQ